MSDTRRRQELTKYISIMEGAISRRGDNVELCEKITELKKDISNDFFTVLVVGVFKRGKSTFINALLGEELMLTNVLPETATIQAIMYGEDKVAEIVYEDGSKERGMADLSFFKRFSPKNLPNEKGVRYIKVSYPCSLLKNKVVLVDTPGVRDLDEQRVQVTYDFLPKANAIIMMLEALAPISRSEKEFIEEHILSNGVSKVIFVLNKIDMIDEDRVNINDVVETTKKRIREIFSEYEEFKNPIVIPVSAYYAMCGIKEKDATLIAESNIRTAIDELNRTLFGGDIENIKLDSYKKRLESILEQYKAQFNMDKNMLMTGIDALNTQLSNIIQLKDAIDQKNNTIANYIENETRVLMAMFDKSLDKFSRDLSDDVFYEIDRYSGSEFKSFVERDIPHLIKKKTDMWLQSKEIKVDVFFGKLNSRISEGMSELFHKRVYVDSEDKEISVRVDMNIQAQDVSGATLGAGVVAALGAITLTAVGLGSFAPLVSMALLPTLRNSFLKEQLASSKEMVLPQIQEEIAQHIERMRNVIEQCVYERANDLVNSMKRSFGNYMENYQLHIEKCIEQKKKNDELTQERIKDIDDNYALIEKVLASAKTI